MDYIKKTPLDTKDTGGQVGQPTFQEGVSEIIKTKSADITNASTDLNQTASNENLSAKFKTPNVTQDVPEKGRNQYM